MDKESRTVCDIFNSSFIAVCPDGSMKYESVNKLNETKKKDELKFSFRGDIVGEQWRKHEKIWVHFTNKKLIVPREEGEREIVGILFKTKYDDYIQLGLALSTEAILSHANMIQTHKSDVRLLISIDARPEDWEPKEIIDLKEISVSSSITPDQYSPSA